MVAPRNPSSDSLDGFLAELLSDQQKLQTPVTRAATAHALQPSTWRAEKFRELIPLTAPSPGQQYAFEVDLDRCTGCKACVAGCHSLNGLDHGETWRDVGVVVQLARPAAEPCGPSCGCANPAASDTVGHPAPEIVSQTVTTACHHCEDPGCLNGCPVLAYEKDPATGIVRHLDDQCIGCSYCVLKCPYDVPKYNQRLGIVRKCDLCHGRLSAGEAPACAQACPTQAIRIVVVERDNAARPFDPVVSLPQDPAYTRPTTRYVSRRPVPAALQAADRDILRPQPAHWPLVFLLVGTQLSLGLLLASLFTDQSAKLAPTAAALFFASLGASALHLGQPLRAWRVFLNLRKSWLSREAVLLGAAAPLIGVNAALPYVHHLPIPAQLTGSLGAGSGFVGHAAVLLAGLGVACSAALYIDTRRRFWAAPQTLLRMGGTTLITTLALAGPPPLAALALTLKLGGEAQSLFGRSHSARLQRGPLRRLVLARFAFGLGALTALTYLPNWVGLALFGLGEVFERTLFFRAVDSPKMPGQPASVGQLTPPKPQTS